MKFLRRTLALLLAVVLLIVQAPVVNALPTSNPDYLSITLADIIIAWYNAAGTAIGSSELANAIYDLYGGITIEDLVDHDVIRSVTGETDKAVIKEMIGYGNLTVPVLYVHKPSLQSYLGDIPLSNKARDSLIAMFDWSGKGYYAESIFAGLASAIGVVVNDGKIAYQWGVDTLKKLVDGFSEIDFPIIGSLKDLYHNFTDSTYFQDLLKESTSIGDYFDYSPYTVLTQLSGYDNYYLSLFLNQYGICLDNTTFIFPKDVYMVLNISSSLYPYFYAYNATETPCNIYKVNVTKSGSNFTIQSIASTTTVEPHTLVLLRNYVGNKYYNYTYYGPIALNLNSSSDVEFLDSLNPWRPSVTPTPGVGNGVTEYINNSVGNITNNNYYNLTPNIKPNEYLYIFNRTTYEVAIGQISQNTNNGQYAANGDIINNYNYNYTQDSIIPDVRPSSPPAPSEQIAQPWVSPRPTIPPEEAESIFYDGKVPDSIKNKFPFCIPWDLKVLIEGLYSPVRKAPYLHWDATFGSWGKLGEVTIDLSEFDTVAQIHRTISLILWILGLVLITKNLLS